MVGNSQKQMRRPATYAARRPRNKKFCSCGSRAQGLAAKEGVYRCSKAKERGCLGQG